MPCAAGRAALPSASATGPANPAAHPPSSDRSHRRARPRSRASCARQPEAIPMLSIPRATVVAVAGLALIPVQAAGSACATRSEYLLPVTVTAPALAAGSAGLPDTQKFRAADGRKHQLPKKIADTVNIVDSEDAIKYLRASSSASATTATLSRPSPPVPGASIPAPAPSSMSTTFRSRL